MMPSFGSLLAALIAALLAAALTSAHVANIRQSTPTFNGQDGNFAATMDPCSTGGEVFVNNGCHCVCIHAPIIHSCMKISCL